MLLLEAFVKFGAISLLIAMGLLMARDGRKTRVYRFSMPLILAIAFMLLTTGSPSITLGNPWAVPFRLFDCLNTVFVWWFGLAMFEDDFELGVREWVVAIAFACLAIWVRLHYLNFDVYWRYSLDVLVSTFSFILMTHLCYKALTGHKEDLIERRRRIRIWFVLAVAGVSIAATLAERIAGVLGVYENYTIWVTHFFTFPLALWAVLWLTKLHPEMLAFDNLQPIAVDANALSAADQIAYEKLLIAMDDERAYTNHGLTIAELASRVEIPPHQLRKLINQSMGHRNFSSFLNKYRLAEVKRSLTDPEKARIPILTLALEAGFSSLAPFNRAFKLSEDLTPSDYRAQFLNKNSHKPVQN